MTPERRAVEKALDRYDLAGEPPAALVHAVLSATAQMLAIDTGRVVSFVVDGYAITRRPAQAVGSQS